MYYNAIHIYAVLIKLCAYSIFNSMSCCMPPSPVVTPSPKAVHYAKILKVIMICEIIVSILFLSSANYIGGLFELMLVYFLWNAVSSYHYCTLFLYEIIIFSRFITAFCSLGNCIQHNLLFNRSGLCTTIPCNFGYQCYKQAVMFIGFAFYIFVLVMAFYGYREFKALFMEQVLGGAASNSRPDRNDNEEPAQPRANVQRMQNQNNQQNRAGNFQGRGVRIGG